MSKRLETNAEGGFYVTTACINCDQCRQLAPETFAEIHGYSAVTTQPEEDGQRSKALHALLSCPTGAIVSDTKAGVLEAAEDFPLHIDDNVYYCGFTSRHSYGASSYLIVRPEGNWLIDAPRWSPPLVKRLEQMGGIRYIFLTHRDDVADAASYAKHFGADRFIHALELAAQPDAEHIVHGVDDVQWSPDIKFIIVPGHTRGHMVLLYDHKYVFTGDHLAWERETNGLTAHRDVCWYSWPKQTESMKRLSQETFEWILPGHGDRGYLPQPEMKKAMLALLKEMER